MTNIKFTNNNDFIASNPHNKSKSYVQDLRSLFSNTKNKDKSSIKPIDNTVDLKNKNLKLDYESAELLKEIKILEKSEEEISNEIKTLKRNELNRVNREFLLNEYGRRFNVTQESVISALIGEDYTENEFNSLKREQNVSNKDII